MLQTVTTPSIGEAQVEASRELRQKWQRTSRSRLHFELAGLALARRMGLDPEDYARYLWSKGAQDWMGRPDPTAKEYLLKEGEAILSLFPGVSFSIGKASDEDAELTFTRGCLGGWGKDRWAVARRLNLTKSNVCRYCHEAFRVWSAQLGLSARTYPQQDGTCTLHVSVSQRPQTRD